MFHLKIKFLDRVFVGLDIWWLDGLGLINNQNGKYCQEHTAGNIHEVLIQVQKGHPRRHCGVARQGDLSKIIFTMCIIYDSTRRYVSFIADSGCTTALLQWLVCSA